MITSFANRPISCAALILKSTGQDLTITQRLGEYQRERKERGANLSHTDLDAFVATVSDDHTRWYSLREVGAGMPIEESQLIGRYVIGIHTRRSSELNCLYAGEITAVQISTPLAWAPELYEYEITIRSSNVTGDHHETVQIFRDIHPSSVYVAGPRYDESGNSPLTLGRAEANPSYNKRP